IAPIIYPSLYSYNHCLAPHYSSFFFFTAPPTTALYTLSLHDALPISNFAMQRGIAKLFVQAFEIGGTGSIELRRTAVVKHRNRRSEEHTSELQSRGHLVCRLLLEKKKKKKTRAQQNARIVTAIPVAT